ncbi:Sec-independent protein translocase protein TatB [Roseibaca ekhonensis]|uniref:Sec-independent protein translocase protein TatB n=1 Tax=Roseinatronobacter ekhonensis TaxID=254356 RepID=A0A3B0MDY5_9RHOB|nr:Sec-independent protein translocase protein TatB [Roseibaca ekhonensis]SUZ31908.1 Sec-independent protein translocase protein TatB [Roseibaca ekhonensis]
MFDLGWTELLVIGVVALIVVGPKDLPKMFRTLGQMTAKARSMAREFSRAMEDAADQSGVKDVARDLRGMADPQGMGLDEFNKMKNWDPLRDDPKGTKTPDSAAAAGDDEDEMDRIAAEMDAMRSDAAKRAAPKPSDATPADAPDQGTAPKPASVADASDTAPSTDQAKPKPKAKAKSKAKPKAKADPEGSTDSTT